ncbi:patellin-6-like [Humulus lupulus]|uniref:patellin-6-like n=1 Tax=Humulus lupulus TaxID=3486 RepID=UPI002B4130C3|nr:patellin-6-like [Humulus lupulus]
MPKRELRVASNQILSLFQDNYPEIVAHNIFINVPWYFNMLYSVFSPFLTQRTKSKFVISKEGNVAKTLYKPEDAPVQYGGLNQPSDFQNGPPKPASEFTVKGGEKVNIQIEGIEVHHCQRWCKGCHPHGVALGMHDLAFEVAVDFIIGCIELHEVAYEFSDWENKVARGCNRLRLLEFEVA